MAMIVLAIFAILITAPAAFGWGLMTHVELAESLLTQGALLAAGAGALLLRHRRDFMLGNLLADVMFGKKLSSRRQRSHDWTAGWRLLEHAHSEQTKAFAYGFLTHLAADTVAHNDFIPRQIVRTGSSVTLGHLYWEVMADQLTDPIHRKMLRRLLREPSAVHEQLLEDHLYPSMKWFGFNRGIFMKVQRVAQAREFSLAMRVCHELSMFPLQRPELDPYKQRAVDRMAEILLRGKKSLLVAEDPNGSKALMAIYEKRRKRYRE